MYFSNMEMTLETLVIPDGVITVGIAHYGYGYGDSSHGNSVSGEWSNILKFLSGDGSIVTRSGDEYIPAA